jgi:signal transduction histidine kinase
MAMSCGGGEGGTPTLRAAATRGLVGEPVAAVCGGMLPLIRAGLQPDWGEPNVRLIGGREETSASRLCRAARGASRLPDTLPLEAFAASAATAIATAETVEAERRRQRLAATEQERARWARELHDETLQSLATLRVGLAAQLHATTSSNPMTEAVRDAVAQLDNDIGNPRALITDLRPAALDELGTKAAIEDLADRARGHAASTSSSPSTSPTSTAARPTGTPPSSKPRSTGSSKKRSPTPKSTAGREERRSRSKKTKPASTQPSKTTAAALTPRRRHADLA